MADMDPQMMQTFLQTFVWAVQQACSVAPAGTGPVVPLPAHIPIIPADPAPPPVLLTRRPHVAPIALVPSRPPSPTVDDGETVRGGVHDDGVPGASRTSLNVRWRLFQSRVRRRRASKRSCQRGDVACGAPRHGSAEVS
jgi:hypothetical protein